MAVVGVLAIGATFNVWHVVTAGDLIALALTPVWLSEFRHRRGGQWIMAVGLLAVLSGVGLTLVSSLDHEVRLGTLIDGASLMLAFLSKVGFLVWARRSLSMAVVVILYGLGMVLSASGSAGLSATNPWRFGFSVPVTVLAFGLTLAAGRRGFDLLLALILVVVSASTDARSSFAILLLTAILLAWQMRPLRRTVQASAARAILGMAVVGVVVYNLGVALILSGLLGVQTQQRSLRQIDLTGSLILGGRPELVATLALIQDRLIGFGSGTRPNYHDVTVVKQAMSSIGYDPNNGYVERQMLGSGYALHSIAGDLWAQAGLIGLVLVSMIVAMVLWRLGHELSSKTASGLLIYLSIKSLWNVMFGPWYSSIPILALLMGLMLYDWRDLRGERRKESGHVVTS